MSILNLQLDFRLHNHWWLLGWMFIAGTACYFFVPKRREAVYGRIEARWYGLAAFLVVVPYILWSGWRTNGFGDTTVYRARFDRVPVGLSHVWSYFSSATKDRGYALLEVLFKSLVSSDSVAFFTFIALFQMVCLVVTYRRFSQNYWLSIFFFIASGDYLSWFQNGMRQFIAVCIIFLCLPFLIEKKYIPMILGVLLAATFHTSALIFLPFIFIAQGKAWNWRTILFILIVIISILFVDRFSSLTASIMEETVYENDIQHFLDDTGTNIIRSLFYSVPAIMAFIYRRRIAKADNPLINVCVNLSAVTAGIYFISSFTSGVFMGRVPIYFSLANYILIPWIITEVFDKRSALIITSIFIVLYCIFFYYQVGVTWGLLSLKFF